MATRKLLNHAENTLARYTQLYLLNRLTFSYNDRRIQDFRAGGGRIQSKGHLWEEGCQFGAVHQGTPNLVAVAPIPQSWMGEGGDVSGVKKEPWQ